MTNHSHTYINYSIFNSKKDDFFFFKFYRCHVAEVWWMEGSRENKEWHFDSLWYFHPSWYDGLGVGFYIAVRSRNWELRNSSLKKLVCLFHAFDKQNYLRMIPYHFVDLQTFSSDVIDFFSHSQGCFSVSISDDMFYSVALGEAHEMELNLKTKMLWILSASPISQL